MSTSEIQKCYLVEWELQIKWGPAVLSSPIVINTSQSTVLKYHKYPPFYVRYDHILKWELFQLADLDTYQGMLKLLFMKELEHIVKSYEAYRQALLSEVEARKQRQQWYAQQPNKNFIGNMWCVCVQQGRRAATPLWGFHSLGAVKGFLLKSWLTLNCLFTKHICAFAWSKYISQEVDTHIGKGPPRLPIWHSIYEWPCDWKETL